MNRYVTVAIGVADNRCRYNDSCSVFSKMWNSSACTTTSLTRCRHHSVAIASTYSNQVSRSRRYNFESMLTELPTQSLFRGYALQEMSTLAPQSQFASFLERMGSKVAVAV